LSERCTGYEFEIGEYREELDKMNKICETLFHENETLKNKQKNMDTTAKTKLDEEAKKNKELSQEIERWMQKYNLSQENKQNEIETIKAMMEKQRKSMIDR
jgi:septation ring formation regulator EzrA